MLIHFNKPHAMSATNSLDPEKRLRDGGGIEFQFLMYVQLASIRFCRMPAKWWRRTEQINAIALCTYVRTTEIILTLFSSKYACKNRALLSSLFTRAKYREKHKDLLSYFLTEQTGLQKLTRFSQESHYHIPEQTRPQNKSIKLT